MTDLNSATSVMFDTPRQHWTGGIGGDGTGIAEFTNNQSANLASAIDASAGRKA